MRLIILLTVLASSYLSATSKGGTPLTYDPMNSAYNALCDGATSDTQAFANMIRAIAASSGTVKMPAGKQCKVDTLTIPANVAVDYGEGGGFYISTGETLTILGPQIAPSQQIFSNALASQGAVSFAGNTSALIVRPEWWQDNTSPGVTDMTAAINAAIQAANPGSTVALNNSYRLSGAGPDLVRLNKNVNLIGSGANGTFLNIAATVGPSTDVIHISIPGEARFLTINGISIVPISGNPGRYGIHLDISQPAQRLANLVISDCHIEQLGREAIHLSNPIPNMDGFFVSQIEQNFLVGGISMQNAGDTITIRDNTITGAGIGIDWSAVAGANKSIFAGNNITSSGGAIRIQSGTQISITDNNIEQVFNYTGSSNTMVDLAGNSNSHIINTGIKNNTFNALGKVTNLIRVDYAENTVIEDNNLQKGMGASLNITSNALSTDVRSQRWGTPEIAPSVVDNGIGTKGVMKAPNLTPGWETREAEAAAVKYWKDSANQVHFRGRIFTALAPARLSDIVWTLPSGFRPAANTYLGITIINASGEAEAGYLEITQGGTLTLRKHRLAPNESIIMDGVSFPVP